MRTTRRGAGTSDVTETNVRTGSNNTTNQNGTFDGATNGRKYDGFSSDDVSHKGVEQEKPIKKKKKKKNTKRGKNSHKGLWVSIMVISLLVLGLAGAWGYYNFIAYPPMAEREENTSGLGAIRRWNTLLKGYDCEGLSAEVGTDSYIAMEKEYANKNEDVDAFMTNVVNTVQYTPRQVEALNIYGNKLIDRTTKQTVLVDMLLNNEGDMLDITYIDYSKITFDTSEVLNYLKSNNISPGDPDYQNQIVAIFCRYMNSLTWSDMPLTTVEHAPMFSVSGDGVRTISSDEDKFLDNLLFASDAFHDMLDRFDKACNGTEGIPVTKEWETWNKSKDKKDKTEPEKYDAQYQISRIWCGANMLQNEYKDDTGQQVVITPQSGSGDFDTPAAVGTSVLTYVLVHEDKKTVAYPVRVELTRVLTGEDCLDYLAKKDTRNRGLDESSRNRYAALEFKITNISGKTLRIDDNSSLADKSGNLSARTGTMYGLRSSLTLKNGESGVIESWVASTELDRKYLVWGADFDKRAPLRYFEVFKYVSDTEDVAENAE